jgi:hypothetical protein
MEWQNKELMTGEIIAWAIIHIFDFFEIVGGMTKPF